ncbi:MAG: hemerythrin family protein [SAR324 cluster bacterium]|nr:hemerythrin family protein [SAR324 cluster bacterium]
MPIVHWRDDYTVKVNIFDDHHKTLFNAINQLYDTILERYEQDQTISPSETNAIQTAFDSLLHYTEYHFTAEEKELEYHAYPDYAQQKKAHDFFKNKIIAAMEAFKNSGEVEIELLEFLKRWLIDHILVLDRNYSGFLNSKGVT